MWLSEQFQGCMKSSKSDKVPGRLAIRTPCWSYRKNRPPTESSRSRQRRSRDSPWCRGRSPARPSCGTASLAVSSIAASGSRSSRNPQRSGTGWLEAKYILKLKWCFNLNLEEKIVKGKLKVVRNQSGLPCYKGPFK